jgi:tRNA dimethylallyltransferase
MKDRIVCRVITGPTASGKTALSLRMAEKHGWEICCMDSMQIYRGMDIGTAKPTEAERQRVRHHLLDICDPGESFSVTLYREAAESLIRRKWEEERRELLFVGGTGLYLQAMMHPMGMGTVPADEEMRRELHQLADQPGGREKLHVLLEKLDPETAEKLPLNDIRRIVRAIEVTRISGIPFSRQPQREMTSEFTWKVASTSLPREILYERINRRVENMMEQGLEGEVRSLLNRGVSPEAQSMQALGYKELVWYLEGIWPLDRAVEEIRKRTRHYAKRQETFLKREPQIQYINMLEKDAFEQAESILT